MIKFIKENKDKSHPVFWAPFVIVGNDQKIKYLIVQKHNSDYTLIFKKIIISIL